MAAQAKLPTRLLVVTTADTIQKIILYLAWYQLTVSKPFAIFMIDNVFPSSTSLYSLSLFTGRAVWKDFAVWLFWSP
jgi:hypothetical protein